MKLDLHFEQNKGFLQVLWQKKNNNNYSSCFLLAQCGFQQGQQMIMKRLLKLLLLLEPSAVDRKTCRWILTEIRNLDSLFHGFMYDRLQFIYMQICIKSCLRPLCHI